MRKLLWALRLLAALTLSGLRLQRIPDQGRAVKAAWREVLNQYQRRADLIPNLVATVQGYASQEKDVLLGVTEARARATIRARCRRTRSTIPRRCRNSSRRRRS